MSSSSSPIPSLGTIDNQQLSAGETAGIAIACATVGIILGWLAAVLRYRRRHRARNDGSSSDDESSEPKGSLSPALSSGRSSFEPGRLLLEPTPDKDLAAQVTEIGGLIQAHVESYYHLEQVQPKLGSLVQGLGNLGVAKRTDMTSGELVSLVLSPNTRYAALQHIISLVVFKSIDFSARSRLSILPSPVAAFLKAVPPEEPEEGSAEVVDIALTKWRTLSAFLLHPHRSQKAALAPDEAAIASQAMAIVSVMNTFLYPFIEVAPDAEDKLKQAKDLQAIILKSAKLGYAVFCHPCEWHFNHFADVSQPTPGLLVVCSGLEKISSWDGKPLPKPVQVVVPAVKKL